MARRALSPACLGLVQAIETVVPPALAATGLGRVTVALSGGADSLALSAATAWATRHRAGGPLAGVGATALVVDHGLQADSAAVAATARAQAEALGLPAGVVRVDVVERGQGVEAAAREARYAALLADPSALVALGHTLDDQAETVLLGLARGSGVRSLAGMADRSGRLVRPLLAQRRTTTEQACRDWGLTWWQDPANADGSYARSRLRTALPELERLLGPGLAEALARTATLARLDADYLDALAAGCGLDTGQDRLPLAELAGVPPVLRQRLLLAWLRRHGGDQVGYDHVAAVDRLITAWHGQKSVSLPGGRVSREGDQLVVAVVSTSSTTGATKISLSSAGPWSDHGIFPR